MCRPTLRLLPWGLFSLAYSFAVTLFIGVRDDLSARLAEADFIFEMALALLTSLSASIVSAWISVPDNCGKKANANIPTTLAAILILWYTIKLFTNDYSLHLHIDHCLEGGLLLALMPITALILTLRKGATCSPRLMCAMNILAVGGLSFAIMRLVCSDDTPYHAGVIQIMPFLIAALIMSLASRKIYKW
ncbi:MAG: DUF1109 family protein [Micavibrio sp.]|nr:DUF1109 family protein [Micavibrio sp.]